MLESDLKSYNTTLPIETNEEDIKTDILPQHETTKFVPGSDEKNVDVTPEISKEQPMPKIDTNFAEPDDPITIISHPEYFDQNGDRAPPSWSPSDSEPTWETVYLRQREEQEEEEIMAYIKKQKEDEEAERKRYENENVIEKIEEEGKEIIEELEDDLPVKEYDGFVANLAIGNHEFDFKKAFKTFRWVIYIVVVFVPYWWISIACFTWNVVLNIMYNKIWAGGNLWLVGNTLYLLFQIVASWPLMLEIPTYLRHAKFIRYLSILSGSIYNLFIISDISSWLLDLYAIPEETMNHVNMLDVLFNMFLVYNAILHSSIVIINSAIIAKEIELVFYQLARNTGHVIEGYTLRKYDLNFQDMVPAFWAYFNPWEDLIRFWYWAFGFEF